jgi:hypothetical protein
MELAPTEYVHIECNSILAQNVILHIFQKNPRELPLYLCIHVVQQMCV